MKKNNARKKKLIVIATDISPRLLDSVDAINVSLKDFNRASMWFYFLDAVMLVEEYGRPSRNSGLHTLKIVDR